MSSAHASRGFYDRSADDLLEPDILTHISPPDERSGYWYLDRAVLELALSDLRCPPLFHPGHQCKAQALKHSRQIRSEVRLYFLTDEPDYHFSFVNVCDRLHISPNALRAVLVPWLTEK